MDLDAPLLIPEIYERYLGPYIFEPCAQVMAGRISGAPRHVLEIAGGTGRVTQHISARIGENATFIASDINADMLSIAARRATAWPVNYVVADAQDLPFADASFDCVVCQFGLMFLPDVQRAFHEAWRVLRPGGQFLFSTWDRAEQNITYHISHQTILRHLPSSPPSFFGKPYSMFDPDVLRSHARHAGFRDVRVDRESLVGESPSAMDVATGFVEGNAIIHELMKGGRDLVRTVKEEIVTQIHANVSADPVRSQLSIWIGDATK